MSQILITSLLFNLALTMGPQAFAQQESYELMCRNKAKEVAAETYKNCVTELRQNHIGQIRDEYKQKLSELKSHYDNELKKISGGSTPAPAVKAAAPGNKAKKSTARASGARSLPEKTVRTEIVDLQQADSTIPVATSAELNEHQINSDQENLSDAEVVELPVQ